MVTGRSPGFSAWCHCNRPGRFWGQAVLGIHSEGRFFAVGDGVEDQFDAAGNTHLVEDAQQIFLDRMFAKAQFGGDSAVGHASATRATPAPRAGQEESSVGINNA